MLAYPTLSFQGAEIVHSQIVSLSNFCASSILLIQAVFVLVENIKNKVETFSTLFFLLKDSSNFL